MRKKFTCIFQIGQDFRDIFYTIPALASHSKSSQVGCCVFSSVGNRGEVLQSKPLTAKIRKNNETGRAFPVIICWWGSLCLSSELFSLIVENKTKWKNLENTKKIIMMTHNPWSWLTLRFW